MACSSLLLMRSQRKVQPKRIRALTYFHRCAKFVSSLSMLQLPSASRRRRKALLALCQMKRSPPRYVLRCGSHAIRRTNEPISSVSNASESWDAGCASVTPKTASDSVVVVPTRRSTMERQDRVACEIGGNGLCRCRMDLHHFVEVSKNRLKDSISENSQADQGARPRSYRFRESDNRAVAMGRCPQR